MTATTATTTSSSSSSRPIAVVRTSAAKMPNSCWGRYVRVAVILTTDGAVPHAIDIRCKNVLEIVRTWERCHSGTSDRDAHSRALREAMALRDELNSQAA